MSVGSDKVRAAIEEIYGQLTMLRFELGDRATDVAVRDIAERFCETDDDAQAKFFVEVAKIMNAWPPPSRGMEQQAWYIGRHLATCACATPDARAFIHTLEAAITQGT